MTPSEYRKRIEALGFDTHAKWYNFVGLSRSAHFRHLKDNGTKQSRNIPQTLINIVLWLESGDLKNPNNDTPK